MRRQVTPEGMKCWERRIGVSLSWRAQTGFTFFFSLLIVGWIASFPGAILADSDESLYARTGDIIYGRKLGMALTMDVFTPRQNANGAAIMWLLSDSFSSLDDMIQPELFVEHLRRGYTVFAVVPSSAPLFTVPEIVPDVHRAVRFIRYRANQFHIDPNRIGVGGKSAAGHLALMVGLAGGKGLPFPEPNPTGVRRRDPVEGVSSRVQAVACYYPPTDFLNYGGQGKSVLEHPVLGQFKGPFDFRKYDPQRYAFRRITDAEKIRSLLAQVSPITHVTSQSAPTLILHGDADRNVPIQQAESLVDKLKGVGVPARLVIKRGSGHGWPDQMQDMHFLADWFDKYLKKVE